MKAVLLLAIILSPVLASAQTMRSGSETGSDAKSRCIHDPDIVRTERPDDQTILFYMRDHTVWKNSLQVSCIGLKNEPDGFTYQPTDPSEELLCSNQVTIRLNSFHSFCQLGDFNRVQVAPEPNPAGRVVR